MSPGRPYERAPSDSGDTTIEWRVSRLEEAEKNRDSREEAWRNEVRAVHAQILTQQALTNQTLGHGDLRMDQIDEHLQANDQDRLKIRAEAKEQANEVSALKAGHAVLHAKVRGVTASRHDPRTFWTAIGSGIGTALLIAWEFIKEHVK